MAGNCPLRYNISTRIERAISVNTFRNELFGFTRKKNFSFVFNQAENGKYNPIPVDFTGIGKVFHGRRNQRLFCGKYTAVRETGVCRHHGDQLRAA